MPTLFARLLGLGRAASAGEAGLPPLLTRLLGGKAPAAGKPAAWPVTSTPARGPVGRSSAPRYRSDYSSGDTATWTFPHEAVASSNLASVAYDYPSQQLEVRFLRASRNTSGTCRYSGVPLAVYNGLMQSPSKGHYHHALIRGRYTFTYV